MFGRTTFGGWDVEKVHALWREAHFESKCEEHTMFGHFWSRSATLCDRHHGFCTLSNLSQTCGLCSIFKNDGRRGTFEGFLQRCFSRGKCSTIGILIRDVRRSGCWFPERGSILEHQTFRFAKIMLRDRCSTSYDLASLFRGRLAVLDRWNEKNANRIGTRPSALHSTFHFWRKSRRIVSFFDVVNFENWGSLAELLRFWHCQVPFFRMSRRIASIWTCNCFLSGR